MRLRITMMTGETMQNEEPALEPETWETTAAQFIEDNGYDGDEIMDLGIMEMNCGDSFVIGGGAAPEFRIERIA